MRSAEPIAIVGVEPSGGDITYCAPWGNLAIFSKNFGYSPGLIKFGELTAGVDQLAERDGEFEVTLNPFMESSVKDQPRQYRNMEPPTGFNPRRPSYK